MKTTRPRSFPASAQASISGRMFLSEWEKQSVFFFFFLPLLPLLLHCTHYMSSLPTNHVLEIEPGERVLSLDFTPLHPPQLPPFSPLALLSTGLTLFFRRYRREIRRSPPSTPPRPSPSFVYYYFFFGPFSFLRLSSTTTTPPHRSLSASVSPCRGTLPRFLQAGLFALAQREWILTRNWPPSEKRRHTLLSRDRPPLSSPPWRRPDSPQPHSTFYLPHPGRV